MSTLGKKRVGYDANEDSTEIRNVKLQYAKMIDFLESQRGDKNTSPANVEKQRLISLAQTKIEEACMFTVKVITTD